MKAFILWSLAAVTLMYTVPYVVDARGFAEYVLWCLVAGLYLATALHYVSRRW